MLERAVPALGRQEVVELGVEPEMRGVPAAVLLATGQRRYEELVDGTRVTWRLQGELEGAVFGGYMALFMDGMLGGMFRDGLELLREAVRERR